MSVPVTLSDGTRLTPVAGFRDAVLRLRPSATPSDRWSKEDYVAQARRRTEIARRRSREIADAAPGAQLSRGLEIGCGGGLDCVLAALEGMDRVLGVDVDPPLLAADRRAPFLRLIAEAAAMVGSPEEGDALLVRLPVEVRVADARALDVADRSFDVLWSRVALEHMQPLDAVLVETARVLRPDGIAHHVIDPFFWLKGCHSRGLTDLPWAHARLALDDYERFVASAESRRRAARRTAWLRSLNTLGLQEWRAVLETQPGFELLSWRESHAPQAEELLERHPEVLEDLLPGVTAADLTCSSVTVILRRNREPAVR